MNAPTSGTVVVRARADADALVRPLRRLIAAAEPEAPAADVQVLAARVAIASATRRLHATLLAPFSLLALVLAVVGVHGVLAYTVTQRARDGRAPRPPGGRAQGHHAPARSAYVERMRPNPPSILALLSLAACGGERTPATDSTAAPPGATTPAASAAAPDSSTDPWAVRETGAGPVRVGMTTTEARAATAGALVLPVTLDAPCQHVRVRGGPPGLRFMMSGGQVARVEVDSAGVPTARGARVGDPEARVRALYGAGVREEPHKYVEGGRYLVAAPGNDTTRLVVFETDGRVVTRYRAGRLPEVRWVEGCS